MDSQLKFSFHYYKLYHDMKNVSIWVQCKGYHKNSEAIDCYKSCKSKSPSKVKMI